MKIKKQILEQIERDSEKTGPGTDRGPSRIMNEEESNAIDKKAGLQMISLRLPIDIIDKLKALAEKEGIKYQPYIRKQLIQHAAGVAPLLTETRVKELIHQQFETWNKKRHSEKKAAS